MIWWIVMWIWSICRLSSLNSYANILHAVEFIIALIFLLLLIFPSAVRFIATVCWFHLYVINIFCIASVVTLEKHVLFGFQIKIPSQRMTNKMQCAKKSERTRGENKKNKNMKMKIVQDKREMKRMRPKSKWINIPLKSISFSSHTLLCVINTDRERLPHFSIHWQTLNVDMSGYENLLKLLIF